MAWNGSGRGSSDAHVTSRKTDIKPTLARGLIGGLLVAAFAIAAAYWLMSPKAPREEGYEASTTAMISEAGFQKQTVSADKAVVPSQFKDVSKPTAPTPPPPQRPGEVRDGWLMFADGHKMKVAGVITSRVEAVTLADKTFKSFSDRCIATLLTTEFGDGFLGSSEELFSEFDQQFEESLKDEIVIDKDDSDDVRTLKQAIIDTRNDLIERKKAGESLSQVMIETRDKLIELATYREELEAQIDKLTADNDFSEEDQEELLKAANTMLEERGIKPFELPSMAKQYMLMNMNGEYQQ